jgi:PadR family transcriptional regulator, regulatory protein PadR
MASCFTARNAATAGALIHRGRLSQPDDDHSTDSDLPIPSPFIPEHASSVWTFFSPTFSPQPTEVVYNVDNVAEHLGTFEQAVLLALVRPHTPLGKEAYGRAILKEVQHRLRREVAAGAVYATLDRLEQKGLVSSRLAPGGASRGGRPRRHYAIEPDGLRALNDARAAADRLWAGLRWPLKGTV